MLEEQFAAYRTHTDAAGATFQTVLLIPAPGFFSAPPVLVVPGWCTCSLRSYARPLLQLAHNRLTLGITTGHGIAPDTLTAEKMRVIAPAGTSLSRKVATLFASLAYHGIETTDAVGYSEGAIVLATAARLRPRLFRNLVFVNPAGMTRASSAMRLGIRYIRELINSSDSGSGVGSIGKFTRGFNGPARGFFENPWLACRAGAEVAGTDLRQTLRSLADQGIGMSVAIARDEVLFPPAEFYRHAPREVFHEIREVDGKHSNFLTRAEYPLEGLLVALERRR